MVSCCDDYTAESFFEGSGIFQEKLLFWAATNRLTRWLASLETVRLPGVEVKNRFDNLVIECREYFQSNVPSISLEEKIIVENLRKVLGEGTSMEKVRQSLIRGMLQFDG